VNVITEHHRTENLLFAGNEIGVFVSIDRGGSWTRLKGNLPTVPVDDLVIHPRDNDLVVGTHGRSVWIMADITPLEQLSNPMMAEAGRIFPARTATMWAERGDWPFYGARYSASNPPRGTPIRYYLRESVGEEEASSEGDGDGDSGEPGGFTLTITDGEGEVVRTLEAPSEAGINEALWDWRHDAPYEPEEGQGGGGGGGFFGGAPQGPVALPGTYTVSMTVGEETFTGTLRIEADPRRPMTHADRMARHEALMSLHQMAQPLYDATRAVRRLNDQLDEAEGLLEEHEDVPESLSETLSAIQEELEEIDDDLGEVRGWARVANSIQQSSTLPTEDQLWQVDAAWEAAPGLIERLNAIITERMPAFNAMLDEEGVRPDPGEAVTVPRRGGG
jgi:hypothetical protein